MDKESRPVVLVCRLTKADSERLRESATKEGRSLSNLAGKLIREGLNALRGSTGENHSAQA